MISLSKFKKALGEEADQYTDEQLRQMRDQQDELADVLFDIWLGEKNNTITNVEKL